MARQGHVEHRHVHVSAKGCRHLGRPTQTNPDPPSHAEHPKLPFTFNMPAQYGHLPWSLFTYVQRAGMRARPAWRASANNRTRPVPTSAAAPPALPAHRSVPYGHGCASPPPGRLAPRSRGQPRPPAPRRAVPRSRGPSRRSFPHQAVRALRRRPTSAIGAVQCGCGRAARRTLLFCTRSIETHHRTGRRSWQRGRIPHRQKA
eukprot:364187-Chlamydomonas_euryale.AAC.10